MYAELKALGISNRDAAIALMDTGRVFGDATIMDRIDSRTRLSRDIVHVAPGDIAPMFFKDFNQSAQALVGRAIAKQRSGGRLVAAQNLADTLSSTAAQAMMGALRDYHIDDNVYRNALAHIAKVDVETPADRALLYMLLFVVTGCTGDPFAGARAVENFSTERVGAAFRTTEARVELSAAPTAVEDEDDYALGLMRIVGGRLKGADGFHKLSPTEQGTEIGALASGANVITDVDEDVSRHHARIYKQGSHWYIVGLGSTNGTAVISGDDKLEHVVEPPKRERDRSWQPQPFEIFPTDTICLGVSTRFMVMPVLGD